MDIRHAEREAIMEGGEHEVAAGIASPSSQAPATQEEQTDHAVQELYADASTEADEPVANQPESPAAERLQQIIDEEHSASDVSAEAMKESIAEPELPEPLQSNWPEVAGEDTSEDPGGENELTDGEPPSDSIAAPAKVSQEITNYDPLAALLRFDDETFDPGAAFPTDDWIVVDENSETNDQNGER